MLHHLIQRGYKKRSIHDAIKKASLVTREEALADKTKSKSLQRVPFVVTYNPILPNIPKILHEAHPILHASERCTEIFKNVPLVSYWRYETSVTFFAVNGLHLLNLTIQYLPKPAKIIMIILRPTQISVQNAA